MTKKTLLKSSLFPVSVLLLVLAIILACIDVDVAPYPDSFFAPEISHSDRDAHFFVTMNTLYGVHFKEDYIHDFDSINIAEWTGYFKNKVSGADIAYILYKSRLGEIDSLLYYMKDPGIKLSAKLKSNSLLTFSDARSTKDFLYYIGYAKRCEKYSTYNPDDWWDREKTKANDPHNDKAGMLKLIEGGAKQISNANSNFVRQRYAFQVVRLYFQLKQYDSCIAFYNNNATILNSTENTIRYRAMSYVAGAYSEKGDVAEANFSYAIVFDRCNTLRDAAYFSFKPVEENDFNSSLALCASTRQKEILWQMLGIYGDPLRAMKEIYKLNPKSDALDLLLVRAVNSEEEKFLNQSMANFGDNPYADLSSIYKDSLKKDLLIFIKQVSANNNTNKPYEWNLAAGYLDWVAGGTDFERYFTAINTEAANDKLVTEELRLFRLLNKLRNGKAGDKDFENNILPDLKWLKDTNHADGFRREFAWAFVSDFLSKRYSFAGHLAISICFNTDPIDNLTSSFHNGNLINDSVINEMEHFDDKKDKSPFEQFALSLLPIYKPDFIDVEAIHYMYKYNFKAALAQLNSNNAPGPEPVYGDPFIIHIMDNHDSDAVLPNKSVKTKKEFLEKMVELQKKADNNTKNANDYFMLANGYYNMSYFGNNRVFFTSKLTTMVIYFPEFDYGQPKDTLIYMDCDKALQYYQKAMNISKDVEFKAKCCFMCAKCEQNYFFIHKPKDYQGDFKAGKYFDMLHSSYASTQYYQEVIKECGYFDTYLKGK